MYSFLNVFFSCCKNTKNIRNSSLYPRLYFFLCFFREKLCYSAIYAYLCTRNWFAVATCRYRNGGGLRLKGNRVRSPDSPAAVNIFFRNEGHECHRGRTGKHLKRSLTFFREDRLSDGCKSEDLPLPSFLITAPCS